MTNIVGTLVYKITGDSSTLNTDLSKASKQVNKTGDDFETLGKRIKSVSTTVISGVLIKNLIQAASKMEELDNKFNTVFKGFEANTNRWVEKYAKDTKRGEIATKEFLSTQQDLRTGYGDTIEKARIFSQAIVGVTNDLASFSNVPVKEAMAAMQSGLAFQFEALRRLGVSLSVATIEQGSYAKSINKTWLEMTNLEKQEAILSGVVSQSKNALHQEIQLWQDYNYQLGDAALTSTSFANSSQGLNQRLEDLKAELGENLIPLTTDIVQLLLSVTNVVIDADDSIQTLILSAGALGIAITSISGPVGIVIGSLAAAGVVFAKQKSTSEKLADATQSLIVLSNDYSSIIKQLEGDTSKLSDKERVRLEIQKELAKQKITQTLQETIELYEKNNDAIDKYTEKLNKETGKYEAYAFAKEKGIDKISEKLDELNSKEDLTQVDESMKFWLNNIKNNVVGFEDEKDYIAKYLNRMTMDTADKANEFSKTLGDLKNPIDAAVAAIAQAVSDKTIDISFFKDVNEGLYTQIMDLSKKIENGENTIVKSVISVGDKWKQALLDQKITIAESKEAWTDLHILKKKQLKEEEEASIKKLAVDAGVITSEEDVSKISIENLKKRIKENSSAHSELLYLQLYYKRELEKEDREYSEGVKDREEQRVKDSEKAAKEIADKQKETQDKLIENSKTVENMLNMQDRERAGVLESLGNYKEALNIKLSLLDKEKESLESLYAEKIKKGEATEEDLTNITAYYEQERLNLKKETQDKIDKENEDAADKAKELADATLKDNLEKVNSYLNGFKNMISSFSSLLEALSKKQIDELEQLKQKKLEDLGLAEESESEKLQREYNEAIKNGDLKLAGEKQQALEKLKIEEEFDEKKKKLQIESAKRSKEIKKFEASISTLQAVIGFLADPGDWAGIALSTMAAATGAAQIAAIEATPLPSYDVGTFNVTEDHIANIHQGEIIIPSSFSDSIRKGEAYLGKSKENESKVEIKIINNTGAEVSTESSENGNIKEYKIMIGKVVDNQIKDGRFDKSLSSRYGIRRSGYNA